MVVACVVTTVSMFSAGKMGAAQCSKLFRLH